MNRPLESRISADLCAALRPHVPATTLRALLYLSAPDGKGDGTGAGAGNADASADAGSGADSRLCRLTAVLDAGGVLVPHTVTRSAADGVQWEDTAEASDGDIADTEAEGGSLVSVDADADADGDDARASSLVPCSMLPAEVLQVLERSGLMGAELLRTGASDTTGMGALGSNGVNAGALAPEAPDMNLTNTASSEENTGLLTPASPAPIPTGLEVCVDRNGVGRVDYFYDAVVPPEDSGAEYHVWHCAPELDELKEQLQPESWWDRLVEDVHTWLRRVWSRDS